MLVRADSLIARIALALPFRFYVIESARVEFDCVTFVRITLVR